MSLETKLRLPRISAAVCTRNRPGLLDTCLAGFLALFGLFALIARPAFLPGSLRPQPPSDRFRTLLRSPVRLEVYRDRHGSSMPWNRGPAAQRLALTSVFAKWV